MKLPRRYEEYQRQWYLDNIERERAIRKAYSRKFRSENPERHLYQAARARAKQKGLKFNIELEDIVIPEFCPILKEPLIRNTEYAPSVDRWDSRLGYIRGNVWVISRKANVMKNNASEKELKRFSEWVQKTFQPL